MAEALSINSSQEISPVDALWTLIASQKKSVQKALAKRLNESIQKEQKTKVKMTEEEFYQKIDSSIADAKAGHVFIQKDGETTDQFIDRLLCIK